MWPLTRNNYILKYETGILKAPTGFGKTVICCKLIAERQVNTLIIFDICFVLLFILLAILGSPYQSWDYSDPEWSVIGTLLC